MSYPMANQRGNVGSAELVTARTVNVTAKSVSPNVDSRFFKAVWEALGSGLSCALLSVGYFPFCRAGFSIRCRTKSRRVASNLSAFCFVHPA